MKQICQGVITIVIGAVLVWPQAAEAQRYKRDSLIREVNVKQTAKTKKIEPKAKKDQGQPELSADDIIILQGKVLNIRAEQVQQFELLIEDTDPDDPELPDLMFRLAELHAQQERYWRFRAMEASMEADKTTDGQAKQQLQQTSKQAQDSSKKSLLSAVKVYKSIAENARFRNYPRMDEALFYYAYTLQNAKYAKDSRKIFHRLIKDYPDSKYIPEAYLAFADYYFSQSSLANAEQFYDKVLQFPKSRVYYFAMYKKGWVYLNLDRSEDALATFFQVADKTRGIKEHATLNRASKKDFVRAYADVGRPQTAYKAFQRVDKDYAFNMLNILGDIYLEQGQAAKAIFTYRELIGLQPEDKRVCEWQYNVTHAMLTIGNEPQKVREIENLVKLYTTYRDQKILPETNLQECSENAQAVNGEMVKLWHNEALKTRDFQKLKQVDDLYQLYLSAFPDAPDHAELQYYYAELMWLRAENEAEQGQASKLWEETAVAFTDVVKTGKLKGKLLKEAAHAAVLGWKNALAVEPATEAPPIDDDIEKIPTRMDIPAREQKMIEAFDVYIEYVKDPKDEELVMMKFLKARIYWRHNHFDESIAMFEDILSNHIEHETGEYAANLLLDTLNRSQRYDELLKWADILSKEKKFLEDKEDLAQRLVLIQRQGMRKAAESLEKNARDTGDFSQYVDCGEAYVEVFNDNPDAEDADVVLYNAGVCFELGRSIGAALVMFRQLNELFPDSPQAQKALERLGTNYAQIAFYSQAADKLEEYARRFGGEKDAYEALWDAVFYRKGIGDDEKAIENTNFFIRQYGKKQQVKAAEAMFGLTSIYEKKGDEEQVIKHLNSYLKQYGRKGGVDRRIIAHTKIGMILWKQSCPARGVNESCVRVRRERSIASRDRKKKKRKRGITLPTQCGPESKLQTKVVYRDPRKVRAAEKEFKAAIKLFSKGRALKKIPGKGAANAARQALAIRYYTAAKFYLAEQEYEAFLDVDFPKKLDFDPRNPRKRKKSEKAFKEWLKDKTKLSVKASKMYNEVRETTGGGAEYAIAAASRMGQVAQNFSDALFTAQIPKDVRSGRFAEDKVDAYCDELTTAAQPLENRSVEAFGFCLGLSTKLNWFNNWSRLCEKELGQIRPAEFPTAAEMRAAPNNVAAITTVEAPVIRLD